MTRRRAAAFIRVVRAGLLAVTLITAVSTAGCLTTSGASSNAIPMVRVQASTDLDCPQNEIRIEKEWGGRFKAIGCGHKAFYNTGCDGLRCNVAPEGQAVPWRDRGDPKPQPGDMRPNP